MDTLRLGGNFHVLELSANLAQGLPGRLLRITGPGTAPEVVADGLAGPSSMVYVHEQRAVYVTETFAGRVSRVPLSLETGIRARRAGSATAFAPPRAHTRRPSHASTSSSGGSRLGRRVSSTFRPV